MSSSISENDVIADDGEGINDDENGEEVTDSGNGETTVGDEPSDSFEGDGEDTGENNPIVTEINVHPITFDYLSEGKLNINLTDENGLGVSNKTISVQIGEDISNLSTDENGVAVFKYSNSAGSYKVNISFNGDEYYPIVLSDNPSCDLISINFLTNCVQVNLVYDNLIS